MLGGGFLRKTLRKPREGLPEVTTLRGACRQRLNVDAHAPPPPPQITHRAPAIRTFWEGGPSECWGEGFFEKPSESHARVCPRSPPSVVQARTNRDLDPLRVAVFRKTLRKSREGLPEVTTHRGACRQRQNVHAHAPSPPPQIDPPRSRDPDVLGGGAPANAGGRVFSKNPPKVTRGFARGHHPPWCMQTAAERRRSRTTTAASDHPPRSRDPDVMGGGPQRMLGGGFFRKTLPLNSRFPAATATARGPGPRSPRRSSSTDGSARRRRGVAGASTDRTRPRRPSPRCAGSTARR
jgi:hypothetical protein